MVPADSTGISRVPAYSGADCISLHVFEYGVVTLFDPPFQTVPLTFRQLPASVLLPPHCRNSQGLGSCTFARHYLRNHCCFLFLRVLRCFSSPGLPPLLRVSALQRTGCPIRKSVPMRVFAPQHGLSQLITSFVASESQGILHVPFLLSVFRRECRSSLFDPQAYSAFARLILAELVARLCSVCSEAIRLRSIVAPTAQRARGCLVLFDLLVFVRPSCCPPT